MIDQLAKDGDPTAYDFPRPMKGQGFEFSFSGLKTSVRRHWEQNPDPERLPDLAASFQEAVVDVLASKLIKAAKEKGAKTVTVVGGVACNSRLRAVVEDKARRHRLKVAFPSPVYCTDNAAMIGRAAWDLQDLIKPLVGAPVDVEVDVEMMLSPSPSS